MSYPVYWNMAGGPTSCTPMQSPQYYSQDDQVMEFGESWDPNHDPSLRPMAAVASYGWNGPTIQRYLGEPEKNFFTAPQLPSQQYHAESYPYDFSSSCDAIDPVPVIFDQQERLPSSPSQNSPSICSSDESPRVPGTGFVQNNFQSQQSYDSLPFQTAGQPLPDLMWNKLSFERRESSSTHIAPSDLQRFPSQEDININTDERLDLEMKVEFPTEIKAQYFKSETVPPSFPHISEVEIAQCIKNECSPGPIQHDTGAMTPVDEDDADPEAELDQDESTYQDRSEGSDQDYKPYSSRTRKRTRAPPSSPLFKRNKIIKFKSNRKTSPSCCTQTFKDAGAAHKHTSSAHTRAYVCAFAFAGCTSDFASKNEWKRHVTSQHLNLHYWQCQQGPCGVAKSGAMAKSNEFNRKDLYTQHLHRMHAPPAVKKLKKKTPKAAKNQEWEDRVRELQVQAKRERRAPPTKARCPLRDCGEVFEGPAAWDARMEHVGRHLEQGLRVDQGEDPFVIAWAMRERIVERAPGGRKWRFCSDSDDYTEAREVEGEADAEGEDE